MKKRWLVCTLLLIAALALLTTGALANSSAIPTLDATADASGEGWSWDASRATLTLENADISTDDAVLFTIDADDAVVVLKGENKLEVLKGHGFVPGEAAICCRNNLTVTGDGSLAIFSEGAGISASGLSLRDANVTIEDAEVAIFSAYDLVVTNSVLVIEKSDFGISVECNCEIAYSEIMIKRAKFWGISAGGGSSELTISDSNVRVESSEKVGLEVWGGAVSITNSEVYLNSESMAFYSKEKCTFEADASIKAGEDANSLKSTRLGWYTANLDGAGFADDYYTFLVNGEPAKTVYIEPEEPEIEPEEPEFSFVATIKRVRQTQISFTDVTAQTEYCDAIAEAYNRGLMGGVSATEFAPTQTLTRAMVWTVLARANGINTEIGATWDSAGRDWAMREKVSDGTNPNGAVTVEELVTMAWRNVGSPYRVADLGDADVSEWAVEAMRWAYETGILSRGIDPKGNATRALTAHVLTAG